MKYEIGSREFQILNLKPQINQMKHLKINLDDSANAEKIVVLLTLIHGIKSVEIVNENATESELKRALNKSKDQLKSGDFEGIVNDVFDIFLNAKK